MKTYRRTFARTAMKSTVERRKETRDGVLWSVDTANKKCRVKIQGSNELIVAHYPRNLKLEPSWLRIGNAVRIAHRGGVRGYIEVVGEGRAIPTPISGGALPEPGGAADGIISGMVMTESSPQSNGVYVSSGTYRISNVIYPFTGITGDFYVMDDPAPFVMGTLPLTTMGQTVLDVDDAPSAGYFRYDAYVVGTDGVADYIKGTEVMSNPVKPLVPANHILIQYILRIGGDTVVSATNIGIDWSEKILVSVTITLDDEFSWDTGDNNPEKNITISMIDQYGSIISFPDGILVTLRMLLGSGQVWSGDDGYSSAEVTQQLVSLSGYTFRYQRDQTVTETSPFFQIEASSKSPIMVFDNIRLLDALGDPV